MDSLFVISIVDEYGISGRKIADSIPNFHVGCIPASIPVGLAIIIDMDGSTMYIFHTHYRYEDSDTNHQNNPICQLPHEVRLLQREHFQYGYDFFY